MSNKSDKTFHLTVEVDVLMTVDNLWPDGDAPEDPTAEDVVALIAKCGGASSVIHDWNLDEDLTLSVDGLVVR